MINGTGQIDLTGQEVKIYKNHESDEIVTIKIVKTDTTNDTVLFIDRSDNIVSSMSIEYLKELMV